MAPSKDYYNPSNKYVSSGNIVYADDLNKINTAVDSSLESIAADLDEIRSNISDGDTQSRDWATSDPGVRPDPVLDLYSSRAYAIEARGWAQSTTDVISASTGLPVPDVKSARYYADLARTTVDTSITDINNKVANAEVAATSADESATQAGESEVIATNAANQAYASALSAQDSATQAESSKDQVITALNNITELSEVTQELINGLPKLSNAGASKVVASDDAGTAWNYVPITTYGKSLLSLASVSALNNTLGWSAQLTATNNTVSALTNTVNNIQQNKNTNLLVNGDFNHWQINTFGNTAGYTCADKWFLWMAGGTTLSCQRVTFPIGQYQSQINPIYCANLNYTYFDSTSSFALIENRIEDVTLLSGQTITITFYIGNSNAAVNIVPTVYQNFGTGGSPSTEVIHSTPQIVSIVTGWNKYSVTYTLPSVEGKVIGTNQNSYTGIRFWLSSGSAFAGQNANLGQKSGSLYLSRVKVELGSRSSDYYAVNPAADFLLCKRYCEVVNAIFSPNTLHNTYRYTPKAITPTIASVTGTGAPTYTVMGKEEMYQSSAATTTGTATITLTSYI